MRKRIDDDIELQKLIQGADYVPKAPDCRPSVMAEIERCPVRGQTPWIWALGFASAVVAVVLCAILLKAPSANVDVAMAPKPPAVTRPANITVVPPSAFKVKPGKQADRKQTSGSINITPKEEKRDNSIPDPKRHAPKKILPLVDRSSRPQKLQAELQPDTVGVTQEQVASAEHHEGDEPVAEVSVTWPSDEDKARDDRSFSYTKYDPKTGETTHCSGKRVGNAIMVCVDVE
ncbi:MAG: hypothetical protein ABFD49_03100 [Armatimonadota bacterium]|nr:hypothetical protein [bacterium]